MELEIQTKNREELVDITDLVKRNIEIQNGLLHIFIPHSSASLTINENADPNVAKDINNFLNKLVPRDVWMHDAVENNADSHIKASLIGNSLSIPVKDDKMQLGKWQNIFVCEFDGPRTRKVLLSFLEY